MLGSHKRLAKTGWILLRRYGEKRIKMIKSVMAAKVGLEAQVLHLYRHQVNLSHWYFCSHCYIYRINTHLHRSHTFIHKYMNTMNAYLYTCKHICIYRCKYTYVKWDISRIEKCKNCLLNTFSLIEDTRYNTQNNCILVLWSLICYSADFNVAPAPMLLKLLYLLPKLYTLKSFL